MRCAAVAEPTPSLTDVAYDAGIRLTMMLFILRLFLPRGWMLRIVRRYAEPNPQYRKGADDEPESDE